MTSVSIPEGVTTIGAGAFQYCSTLSSVVINSNTIASQTYSESSNLSNLFGPQVTNYTFDEGVSKIGSYACYQCSSLESVTIGKNVKSIGYDAFYGCSVSPHFYSIANICSMQFDNPGANPMSQKNSYIGNAVISNIIIPEGVTSIGDYAFYNFNFSDINSGYPSINIEIPASVKEIGIDAFCSSRFGYKLGFEYCTSFKFASLESFFQIRFASKRSNPISYTHELIIDNGIIKDVVVPNGIREISKYALYNANITSLILPNSVTEIGDSAFWGCLNLEELIVPVGVTAIHDGTFEGCTHLKNVRFSNRVTSIGEHAFANCSSLSAITIPENVSFIGTSAFEGCESLSSLYINSNTIASKKLVSIFGNQVENCVYGDNIECIGDSALYNCTSLTSVTIGNGVTSIGSDAFSGCSDLTEAYFPNIESLCVISFGNRGANPLSCARHLYIDGAEVTRVVIPNSVTSIGDFAFSGCSYLTSVTIPNSVTSIGSYAFYYCGDKAPGGLDSVTIPNSVTSIGDYAFAYCNRMTSVTIPYSVTSIGRGAFYECKYLKSITVYIETPLYIEPGTFYKYNGVTLNVPYGSKEAYMKADSWKNFEFIVEVAPIVPATGISLNTISISLSTIGQTSQLIATITPNDATNKSITWTSDNKDVATVSSTGVVTAVANGTAIITATTNDGSNLSATCAVTVNISPTITFEDPNVKAICVANWDTNEDGELSKEEAAAVTDLGTVFKGNTEITSFNELQHFTGLTEIPSQAFMGCSNLMSVLIPDNVTTIGVSSFSGCVRLSSVTIPEGVTTISPMAYNDCLSLTSIHIPASVTDIGILAFNIQQTNYSSSGFHSVRQSITVAEGNTKYDSRENCNALIETATNKLLYGCANTTIPSSVSAIAGNAFSNSIITSIVIPNSVLSIGSGAFAYCNSLSSVTVELETPLTIASVTFTNRASATLYVPAGCKAVYEKADYWKEFGTIVEMEVSSPAITFADNNVKAICVANWDANEDGELSEEEAAAVTDLGTVFKSNTDITSFDELQYFTGVTEIPSQAFMGCSNLTSVVIPDNITSIGYSAFDDCYALSSINLPSTITFIDGAAFSGCHSLTSITLPEGIPSMGDWFFDNCTGLTEIVIPSSVTTIGQSAFRGCTCLISIVIPESVASIGSYAFYGCENLTSVSLPGSVGTIGERAFQNCRKLESINIPDGITDIKGYTFCGCGSLKSIEIPESVTSIGELAFYACDNLVFVSVKNANPVAIIEDVFSTRANALLYIPAGSKSAYEAADYWKDFKRVLEIAVIDNKETYYIQNVETGLFLGAGNAWGTHAVLKNEGLPVKFTQFPDGSYTIYFLEGSQNDQLLFRATSEDIYVDYQGQSDGSPFWTITEASDGNYHIQTLITHELYGQEAMPGTYLGNNPNKEASDLNGNALGVYNDVDGDILDIEGMNVTWRLVPENVITHSGDVNGDNQVSIADVTALVNIILGKDNTQPYQYDHDAADVNNDGSISIADVTSLVNIILGKE